jgi:vancomycin resistance protein YoaR
LYPDEEFSTNEHFLPFTEKNGWREAGTIVQGKIEDSIGGGMCQVSTALYDALLEAEVQITERYNHSLKVNYSEYGMDAALAGDYKDLCFKNDTGAPLYIEAYVTRSNVVINIYGKEIHDAGRRIEFESKLIDTIEPGDPIITYDSTLPEGTENITTYALKGRVYELYKKIYENGELKDTVKINTSNYLSRREEKTVGTKKADS